jgi:hypothetical protein
MMRMGDKNVEGMSVVDAAELNQLLRASLFLGIQMLGTCILADSFFLQKDKSPKTAINVM